LEREILLSGIGGQGVQLAAKSLATAAMREGRRVLMFGTYGGVMRGGDTDATLVIGDATLLTPPVVDHAWAVLAMHHKSWDALAAKLRPEGFLMTDSNVFQASPHHPGPVLAIPAIAMATQAGMPQAGSMVALGAFAAATGIVGLDTLLAVAEDVLPPYRRQFAEANRKALALGHGWVSRMLCSAWQTAQQPVTENAL
jgi:2-oxoglutarate ferredoxin oxidoreductase subunit gamma